MSGRGAGSSPREEARQDRLAHELEALGASGLLVVGHNARDPDAAPFLGEVRIGQLAVVARPGDAPRLAFFSSLDRGEAEATGLEVIDPARLEVAKAQRESDGPGAALAWVLGKALLNGEIEPGVVALAGHEALGNMVEAARELESAGYRLVSGHDLMRRVRKVKSAHEIAEIERVAGVVCRAFRAIAGALADAEPASRGRGAELWLGGERLRVGDLRGLVAECFGSAGLDQSEGSILAPGEEGGVPHNAGTNERVLVTGEGLVVDLFPRGRLFADCTRTFCVGEPGGELARAWSDTLAALEGATGAARPGVTGAKLQDATCDLYEERGWPTLRSDPGSETGYVHTLGHGVGFELHELPALRGSSRGGDAPDHTLEQGDVVTIEPGLYDVEAGFGVRLEDLLVVEADGVRNLTPLPYDLDPRAYKRSS